MCMHFIKKVALVTMGLTLAGCATTQTYDYQNPELATVRYNRLVVFVNNGDLGLRKRLEATACQSLAPLPCAPMGSIIFPGDENSFGAMLDTLAKRGESAVLVIEIGQDQSTSEVAGYVGGGSFHRNGFNSFSAPVMSYNRKSKGMAELVDVKSRETAWKGQLNTHGAGLIAVTDGSFERAQSLDLAKHLWATNLFVLPLSAPTKLSGGHRHPLRAGVD